MELCEKKERIWLEQRILGASQVSIQEEDDRGKVRTCWDTDSKKSVYKEWKKSYKKEETKRRIKELEESLALGQDVINAYKKKQKKLYDNIQAGDYSEWEKCNFMLRCEMADQFLHTGWESFLKEDILGGVIEAGGEEVGFEKQMDRWNKKLVQERDRIKEQLKTVELSVLYNPKFRLALSFLISDKTTNDGMFQLEEQINEEILRRTLCTEAKEDATITSQKFLLSVLWLLQKGKLHIKTKHGEKLQEQIRPASLLAHGHRILFCFPPGSEIIEKIKTLGGEALCRRTVATHMLGKKGKRWSEKKVWAWFQDQYGMNLAIGGVGEELVKNKKVKADGGCGYLYAHIREGDMEIGPAILIGIETTAFHKISPYGHQHTLSAHTSYATIFGSSKYDVIGKEYGGRVVSVSKEQESEVGQYIEQITDDTYFKNVQAAGIDALLKEIRCKKMK